MRDGLAILVIISGMIASVLTGKLTIQASIAGGIVAGLIFGGAGFTGIAMLAAFFASASIATAVKLNQKEIAGLAEPGRGQRNTYQVFANGGVTAILCGMVLILPRHSTALNLMAAASLSSAAADTISSEFGNAFGSKFINVLSWKQDQKGLDGVVSLEGTLAGLAASILIALIYGLGFGFTHFTVYIVIAGTTGNFFDSLLGATLERKRVLTNDLVNLLNTLCGAMMALLLLLIFG
ncbi:MAG: DUF92 domain-containing protein [Sediminibacterium sp.]